MHAHESLCSTHIHASDKRQVYDQEAYARVGRRNKLADSLLDEGDGAEEEESLQAEDGCLPRDFADVCPLGGGPADGGHCCFTGIDCANAATLGILDDEEETYRHTLLDYLLG